ncbi:putative hydrolase YxeP [Clostridium acetireducens DSM 10703]|jgi:amidohydrolase|uniref:Putative hydrolase YxeP n=1 Tax=Clostridium acetireducens DSM 10703 TaxID=1121290 RepID=A0A1E8EY32_9CLOT|nr:amidohydrolase [Clostridium acetireducens]OFI05598.1 putative hydrolase YxeP [Clostridium acetireducens DSM 10703]
MDSIDFLNISKAMKPKLIEWRRDFHKNPELGFELNRTSRIIKKFLQKEKIEYYETANTGICAIIKGNGNKTIGLRGDMDALPLEDKKTCDYASSIKGRMHACGHDAHTAILMGAAKILNSVKDKLNGNIKLFFEPGEETTGGAQIMIKEGVLENPHVDAVIGLHVDEKIDSGKIAIKRGEVNASSNPFTIKIQGKGSHGAKPEDSIDPIVIACNVVLTLQSVISREIPPSDSVVITIGVIKGGTARNIIPEEVTISGIIRTIKKEHREYVKRRVIEIVNGVVSCMRGKCEIEIEESYPCLYNNYYMEELLINSAESIIGRDNIVLLDKSSMGVESFAYFSKERPTVFYYLGVKNEEKDIIYPAHGSFFDIDEDALPIGVAIQCKIAVDFLNK